uniref:Uncharacterized protein n=1 Tax=Arundo donax TaxID=35708 RepID=A0A0A9C3Q2_ARUDO
MEFIWMDKCASIQLMSHMFHKYGSYSARFHERRQIR